MRYFFTFISKGKKGWIIFLQLRHRFQSELFYVMKAWEEGGDEAEYNHLDLLHNAPPLVTTMGIRILILILIPILSNLITTIQRLVLILNSSLSLCSKLLQQHALSWYFIFINNYFFQWDKWDRVQFCMSDSQERKR